MAITIIKEPAEIVFSRNPVYFGLQTDNLYNPVGQASVYLFSFPSGPLEDDMSFTLEYGDSAISQVFTAKDSPDDSGTQIRSGAGMTLLDWCNQFIEDLGKNYLLSRDYTIALDLTGVDPQVKLTAKTSDPYYNISLVSALITSTQLTNGVKKERNTNFKIFFEVWLENAAHTEYEKVLTNIFAEVSDDGYAEFNISKTLSESLRGERNDFDTPDSALPLAFKGLKTCRRYYIRYGEVYGEVQTVRKMHTTAVKWAVLGGVGKFKVADYSIATNYLVDTFHLFLKQEASRKEVKLTQPEWLSLIWLDTAIAAVNLHVKVYFTAGDPEEFDAFTIADVAKYDKLVFPTGPEQLDLAGLYPTRIVTYYEVWLTNAAATRLSEVRTYALNYIQNDARFLIELSSLGAYDTFLCNGKSSTEYEITSDKAMISRTSTFTFKEGETLDFDNSLEHKETIRTGWQSRREIARYRDLFLSWDKFLVRNGLMYPISCNTKSIKEFDRDIYNYALEFEIGFRFSEELYSEDDDPTAPLNTSQFIPVVSNPTPDNYDTLYYRKSQTYNKAEVDAFIAAVTATEASNHAAQADSLDALLAALSGKSDTTHNHDLAYVGFMEYNAFVDAVGNALVYKGAWDADYTVDPDDAEQLPGYFTGDVVDYAGTLWRSLVDENVAAPGTDATKWVKIIEPRTVLDVADTTPIVIDWQTDLIEDQVYTWAQKHGNGLFSFDGLFLDGGVERSYKPNVVVTRAGGLITQVEFNDVFEGKIIII